MASIEKGIPIFAKSHFSFIPIDGDKSFGYRRTSVSSPSDIFEFGRSHDIPRIIIPDTNWLGFGETYEGSQKNKYPFIPAVQMLLFDKTFSQPKTVTLIPQDISALQQVFDIYSKAHAEKKPLTSDTVPQKTFMLIHGISFDGVTKKLLRKNPDYYYALSYPPDIEEQEKIIGNNHVVVTHTARYIPGEEKAFRLLAKLNRQNESGISQFDSLLYAVKTGKELRKLYPLQPLGLTSELFQNIQIVMPLPNTIRPKSVPDGMTPEQYLYRLVMDKLSQRYDKKQIIARVHSELETIIGQGQAAVILLELEKIEYNRQRNILIHTRGSFVDSIVGTVLQINNIPDPHHTDSHRFMDKNRGNDKPDIDTDIPDADRTAVTQFYREVYPEYTVPIVVVHRYREDGIKQLAKHAKVNLGSDEVQILVKANIPRLVTIHPTGTIFMEHPPKVKRNGVVVAEVTTQTAEKVIGAIKFDDINNKGLTAVNQISDEFEKQFGIRLEHMIRMDDEKVVARAMQGVLGVLGTDSPHMRNVLSAFRNYIKNPQFHHLVEALALARLTYERRNEFFEFYKTHRHPFTSYRVLKSIVQDTNYVIIYQEQVSQIVKWVAHISPGIADEYRKMMSSKMPPDRKKELLDLLRGTLLKSHYPTQVVDLLTAQISEFASYGFPFGHAQALGVIAMYLAGAAEYTPKEYWLYTLANFARRPDMQMYHLQAVISEAMKAGVEFIYPPYTQIVNQEYPRLVDGKIELGYKLFSIKDPYFPNRYSEIFTMIQNGEDKAEIMKKELEHFGYSFTLDPSIFIPEHLLFNPKQNRQRIVGFRVTHSRRTEQETRFMTIYSGEPVNIMIPKNLYDRKKNLIYQGSFSGFLIEPMEHHMGWKAIDIFPVE